jgi:KDO2-lipid IV(A) lauroyltransferase
MRIHNKRDGLLPAIRHLKRGEDLVIFADQRAARKEGVVCQFLGKKASTMTLVPALAKRLHVPVVPMFTVRCEDLIHHRLIFFPELEIAYDKGEESISEEVQRQNDVIENVIRSYPDHWLWMHRRWKDHYPNLY